MPGKYSQKRISGSPAAGRSRRPTFCNMSHHTIHVTCHISHPTIHVTCHMSHVPSHYTYHMSHVTYHILLYMSHVAYHILLYMSHGTSYYTCHMSYDIPYYTKVGHLQPIYLCLSRLGCSLGELQDVWPDKFCQAKHLEGKF